MAIQTNFPAIKPSLMLDFANTKQLDPRITYTRASTATFYNGVTTAMAEQNLLTYSQEFENGFWSTSSSTKTANTTTAPDGTTTADTITASAGTSLNPRIFPTTLTGTSGSVYAVSIYAKAGTNNYLQITDTTVGMFANYDLSTGVLGTSTLCTSSIVSAGNGWHRCMLTYTSGGTDIRPLFVIQTSASVARLAPWNPVGTETIFIWGAQVEQRSAVSAYTVTTTQAITNYIPALQTAASGVARFDNNPTTGESLGLLIEESRTNLVTYSQDLSNAAWVVSICTKQAATLIAPDGSLSAGTITSTAVNNSQRIQISATSTTGIAVTFSVYVKKGTNQYVCIGDRGESSEPWATFDFNAGTISKNATVTTANATLVGNGWYRISISWTKQNAAFAGNIAFIASSAAPTGTPGFNGTGYDTIFLWGAQLEAGAFATSYIPTVASQVTRAADAASMTGTNFSTWYNQAQGTIYAEGATTPSAPSYSPILEVSSSNNPSGNRYSFGVQSFSSIPQVNLYVLQNNSIQVNGITSGGQIMANSITGKSSFVYRVDDFAISGNGATVATDTSGLIINANQLQIGKDESGRYFNGFLKKIAYYPSRVTNTNLQALTS